MSSRARKPSHYLSKSLYIRGLQCHKSLYLRKHFPELKDDPDAQTQARFSAGDDVGELARDLFPGGVLVPYIENGSAAQIKQTADAMAAGKKVIYEATFDYDGIFVKVDILRKTVRGWQIYEVKSSSTLKEVHKDDVALQYYVLTNLNVPVTKAFVVHLNKTYVRRGDLDLQELFAKADVTREVKAKQGGIGTEITAQRKMLARENPPKIDIGPHCSDPYGCDFTGHCWRHIPDDSVFDLAGNGVDKFALYRERIITLKAVPLDRLKGKQRQQAETAREKQVIVDREKLAEFLDQLWYPLCFLDFETFSMAIPPYDGLKPYQHVPFQYSLHYQKRKNGKLYHREFLAEPGIDPRKGLIEQLLVDIPEEACVLAYHKSFEVGRLKELAEHFPRHKKKIGKIIDNAIDLEDPFRHRAIYSWQQKGSSSIKKVLPAFVKGMSYEGMAIGNGGEAMEAYHEMCDLRDKPEELARLRQALLEYCRQDTLAMVDLVNMVNNHKEDR